MASRWPSAVKRNLRMLLSDQLLGAIDYVRFPDLDATSGGPLNGQARRQALFHALIECVNPLAIVETGTFRGTTTEFMADAGLPVFSVERIPRYFGFARLRLWRRRNVTLLCGDSRNALRSWFDGPLRSMALRTIFFYLDAHWHENLPLAEELDLVFGRCRNAVVMVDDFQVLHDNGYGYDNYGPGKALTPDYIKELIAMHGLCAFYPATPSNEEGGARRGFVILTRKEVHGEKLASLSLLRSA